MISVAGAKPIIFHCQDDRAGFRCRGVEKKSDVQPAKLTANVSFLPTRPKNLGQYFLPAASRRRPRRAIYSAAVAAGFGEPTLSASGVDLTFASSQPRTPKRMSNPKLHSKSIFASGSFDSNIRKSAS
jgi:hypothetical protein